jgi:hypothetical protein
VPHIFEMITREQWRAFFDHPAVEWTIFALGILLMIAAIPVGALPGPGGVFVFAIGLAMVLKTSMWAKRRYVRFKRSRPKAGSWADWALRRRSARRRLKREKELQEEGGAETGVLENLVPDPPLTPPETWADREGRAIRDRSAN